mmetsp:Transcript_40053/g.120688  ORF Transcript_40053/g.120688 Transcript_40053/m.120688 type:complete len:362 (-) Transcript_40053:3882-4967(-)
MASELQQSAALSHQCEKASLDIDELGTVPSFQAADDDEGDILLVGIDFSVDFIDMDRKWANNIVRCRTDINKQIESILLRRSSKFVGGEVPWDKVEVDCVHKSKREKAVVTLAVGNELPGTPSEGQVQRYYESIAKALRLGGVPEKSIRDVLISNIWQGSARLFLDAPIGIFEILFLLVLEAENMRLPLCDNTFVVSVVPALLVRTKPISKGFQLQQLFRAKFYEEEFQQLKKKRDVVHVKQGGVLFLIPTSLMARRRLTTGSITFFKRSKLVSNGIHSTSSGITNNVITLQSSKIGEVDIAQNAVAESSARKRPAPSLEVAPSQLKAKSEWKGLVPIAVAVKLKDIRGFQKIRQIGHTLR